MPTTANKSNNPDAERWGNYRLRGWKKIWMSFCHAIPAYAPLQRIALWLRKPIKMALHDRVDATVWGASLRLFPLGNLSEQRLLYLPQFFDRDERETLAEELRNGGVFFDIGANIGSYSLWVALTCKNTRIEAFEPDPDLCSRLRFNVATNRLEDILGINNVALGQTRGASYLKRDNLNRGQNKLVPSAMSDALKVQVDTLPDFLREHDISGINALKIDVEGLEFAVLQPLFDQVPRSSWPSVIVCEISKNVSGASDLKVWQLLSEQGYVLEKRTRLNGIFRLSG